MATNTIKTVHAGVDVPYNLPTTSADWTEDNNNNFVHTYTDSRITQGCRIEITFKTGTLNTEIPYIEFEKSTGSIDFTVSSIPTVAIPIIIHIINSQSGNVQAVLATDVATSGAAQSLGINVNESLIALAAMQDAIIGGLYPIGSIYMSMNSTMPSILTTGMTWEAVTGDYVLKTTTTETGGTYNNAGDTGSHVLTVDEIPEHKHTIYCGYGETSATGDAFRYQNWAASSRGWKDALIGNKGGGLGHTHTAGMPQNVAVYMWKRTA